MQQEDLATVAHWDSVYKCRNAFPSHEHWQPTTYDSLTRADVILSAIQKCKPNNILEVGCGDTNWLGYLARSTGASVAGIDYCALGCELSRKSLAAQYIS